MESMLYSICLLVTRIAKTLEINMIVTSNAPEFRCWPSSKGPHRLLGNKNRNFIVLDRGERDGVEKGMGVLSPEGAMVGYVAASSDRHAVAVSILNTSFNASGKLAGDDYFGSIYGRVTIATTSA